MSFVLFSTLTFFEFESMSTYLAMLEKSVAEEHGRLEEWYLQEIANSQTEEQKMWVEEYYNDVWQESILGFQRHWLASFVVSWYSFVEQRMLKVCTYKGDIEDLQKTKGKGIFKARKFLQTSIGYQIPTNLWNELNEIRRLRNQIVHGGLRIVGSYLPLANNQGIPVQIDNTVFYFSVRPKLYQYLYKKNLLHQLPGIIEIEPTFAYCEYLITFGRQLFSVLFTDLGIS